MELRHFTRALPAVLALTLGGPAQAQLSTRQDVTVNPSAAGSQVLLYPGGKYVRIVHPLLQPGEADPNAPIRLHMPGHHGVRRVARHLAAKPKVETALAPPPQSMPLSSLPSESAARLVEMDKPASVPRKQAAAKARTAPRKAPPPPATPDTALGFLSGEQPPPAAAPTAKAARVATLESGEADTADLTKRSSIPFSSGAEEPAPSALDTVRSLAGSLNAALSSGSARIQLEAYGGKPGDKSSDARRLSLKRALIVRQLLIDDGIPSERIDVRAMGGASDGGPADRVDIFMRA